MNNGWYRITWPNGKQRVTLVEQGQSAEGNVSHLMYQKKCHFEEVVILDKRSYDKVLLHLEEMERVLAQMRSADIMQAELDAGLEIGSVSL